MSQDAKARADARLEASLSDAAVRDPRPLYRPALKYLKDRDAEAFGRALRHFEEELVPAVAGGADPLSAWREYGRLLAEELGEGRYVEVDPSGRAESADPEAVTGGMLLFLPDDGAAPALVLHCPRDTAPAQDATLDLLVLGRVSVT